MKTLDFTLVSDVIPVTLRTNTSTLELELRALIAKDRDTYLDLFSKRLRLDGEGKPCGVSKFDGLQADLLVLCLFHKGSEKAVTKEEIQSWPATVVSQLYKSAQELNMLGAQEADAGAQAAKNG